MRAAWKSGKKQLEEVSDPSTDAIGSIGTHTSKRIDLLTAFRAKYNYNLEYDSQPSDNTLSLIVKQRAKRTIEFAPLSRVTSSADGRHSIIESIRLGKASPFLVDASMLNVGGGGSSEFNKTPENFTHAVRILLYNYALFPASDPPANTWCSLDADRAHISTVEHYSRLSTAAGGALGARIMEAEMTIRSEWAKVHRKEPGLSLSDVITIVSQSKLRPLTYEFRGTTRPITQDRRGKGG